MMKRKDGLVTKKKKRREKEHTYALIGRREVCKIDSRDGKKRVEEHKNIFTHCSEKPDLHLYINCCVSDLRKVKI